MARTCEEILLAASRTEEAYRRFAYAANRAGPNLATFRATKKKLDCARRSWIRSKTSWRLPELGLKQDGRSSRRDGQRWCNHKGLTSAVSWVVPNDPSSPMTRNPYIPGGALAQG